MVCDGAHPRGASKVDSPRASSRRMGRGLVLALAAAVTAAGCGPARRPPLPPPAAPAASAPPGEATIADRVAQYGPAARARLLPYFAAAGVPYPPARFLLLGLKQERELQLYAAGPGQPLAYIRSFADARRERDARAEAARGRPPGSRGHLRDRLPEPEQHRPSVARAQLPQRRSIAPTRRRTAATTTALGGDIMIHGGCGIGRLPGGRRPGGGGSVRPGGRCRLGVGRGRGQPGRFPAHRAAHRLPAAGTMGEPALRLAAHGARHAPARAEASGARTCGGTLRPIRVRAARFRSKARMINRVPEPWARPRQPTPAVEGVGLCPPIL